ncbi:MULTISPECIES: hypothetical protein [unclassified Chryseobacterium]|uniref:hypothetical protein n=1 Tax=unclassified Chryseobacterium TaxID=2593645 RepID=UPI0021E59287|nr:MULTISPECIES: hypothetical protein [unclassified Chryseobacterium]MEA1850246.1 hypothetical protein [Chryseobacterium sp. MHB01]
MKNYFLVLLLTLILSCSKSSNIKYSFDNILSYEDTVLIKSKFADCGEWGGHDEIIKIYSENKLTKLVYTKYKVNCGVRDDKGSIVQNEEVRKKIVLSTSQKVGLMNYINNLMHYNFMENEFGNSGNSFSVEDSENQLKISHYGSSSILIENYDDLMQTLGFPTVVVKNE